MNDVAQRAADAAVDSSEALLHFLYRAPIGLVEIRTDGQVEMMNPKSAQMLMPITASGQLDNLFDVLAPVAPQLRGLVERFTEPHGSICEGLRFDVEAQRGEARTLAISLMKVDAKRVMAVLVDATGEVRREESVVATRLHVAARVDGLTRMPNRIAIAEAMEAALTQGRPLAAHVAILLIGCERLFDIAESFGDDVRNELLETMARRLRAVLRPTDDMVNGSVVDPIAARVSADEFVVLLQGLSQAADVALVAQRVVDALSRPYVIGSHQLHCAVSIGVVAGEDGTVPDEAMRDAGIAMREAKRLGGSRWVRFDAAMRERAVRRGSTEMELRRALAEDQLFVVYQPIVALQACGADAPLVGVEALVRWQHPDRGIVPPIEFISIAEEVGLIHALGRFVLGAACRQLAAWSTTLGDRAPQLLAVNLSRAQLSDPTIVEFVEEMLLANRLSPERLQLEVTESLAAQDDAVQSRLQELKKLGVKLALDDFGTGYSSLSSLHLLPVDTVKIDRSFITLADTSPHHRVLIEATIKVAKSLGMTTVAEGLETDSQIGIVRELGCDKGQGYRFARPLAANDLPEWIAGR